MEFRQHESEPQPCCEKVAEERVLQADKESDHAVEAADFVADDAESAGFSDEIAVQELPEDDLIVVSYGQECYACPDYADALISQQYDECNDGKPHRFEELELGKARPFHRDDSFADECTEPLMDCCMDVQVERIEVEKNVSPITSTLVKKWPTSPDLESKSGKYPAAPGDDNPPYCCGRCWPINRQEGVADESRGNITKTRSARKDNDVFDRDLDVQFRPQKYPLLCEEVDDCERAGMEDGSRLEKTPPEKCPGSLEKEESDLNAKELAKKQAEDDINMALDSGDIEKILEYVTPSVLVKCKPNSLSKALEVSHVLRQFVRQRGPDEEDFLKLENNVKAFAVSLLDPLKADDGNRDVFGAEIDKFVDKAIEKEQKKFLSYPVVNNLLRDKWYGEFATFQNSKWTELKRWIWIFLNLWTLLDVILFPLLFSAFWIGHVVTKVIRKKKDFKVGFLLYATGPESKQKTQPFMTKIIKEVIETLRYKDGKFAVIARGDGKVQCLGFERGYSKGSFLENVMNAPTQLPWKPLALQESLVKAKELFDEKDEKVLVILTDYKAATDEYDNMDYKTERDDSDEKTMENASEHDAGSDINIIAVSIGPFAKPEQLVKVVTHEDNIIISNGLEIPKELGKHIAEKIQGRSVLAWYKSYFLTPYFVFLRDTLSYLTLLLLHCAVCFSQSTISLSVVEYAILVFFLGRVLMEAKQFVDPRQTKTDFFKCNWNPLLKKARQYFRDRWNALDVITIVTFVVAFVLRLVTLGSSSITENLPLALANYLYGLNTMFLTLRVLGSILESTRSIGVMQIALFKIIGDVTIIFWQFLVVVLAFSLAITKVFTTERSYVTSERDKETEGLCKGTTVVCWWDILRHLTWSLMGLGDTEKFGSADNTSLHLMWALYAIFLLVVAILLVNMLVAVLSNVYQGVEDNSLEEWCFKQAIAYRTYSNYHPIPVPLNLLSVPCMVLYNVVRRRGCSKAPVTKEETEEKDIKEQAIGDLMKILEGAYFSTYGYAFPLTDECKMDHVTEELTGNRRMANQIAQQVFSDGNTLDAEDWSGEGIKINGNTLMYAAPDNCSICQKEKPTRHHSVRCLKPLDRKSPMFQVLIQESGDRRFLSVGVVLSDYDKFHDIPGWHKNSIGYHIDDGKIFYEKHRKLGQELKDAMAYRGDIITCRVHFNEQQGLEIPVSFSLNGKEVGRENIKKDNRELHPCIGMGYEGIRAQFTMGKFTQAIPKAIMHNGEILSAVVNAGFQDVKDWIKETQQQIEETQKTIEINQVAFHDLQFKVDGMNYMLQKIMAALKIENK